MRASGRLALGVGAWFKILSRYVRATRVKISKVEEEENKNHHNNNKTQPQQQQVSEK